jgi:hypothetical protein
MNRMASDHEVETANIRSEPNWAACGAAASWSAAARCRFGSVRSLNESASRRRAEAALWRAAKAEGLAQSKTWRLESRLKRGPGVGSLI